MTTATPTIEQRIRRTILYPHGIMDDPAIGVLKAFDAIGAQTIQAVRSWTVNEPRLYRVTIDVTIVPVKVPGAARSPHNSSGASDILNVSPLR